MKITDIRAFLLSCPMPEPIPLPFFGGVRTIYKRDALYVKVTTDSGITGFGPGAASEPVAEMINTTLRELLIGEDPNAPDTIRQKVDGLGSSVAVAFGAVNVALYDIRGKTEGCPVYELLGGKLQDRIRLYGSAGMYQSAEEYAAEAKTVVDQKGFTAYKYRPALGPEEDLRTVHLMREAVGPDVGLCLDAHGWFRMGDRSYTPELVEQMANDISDLGITWLEEPLPPADRDAYSELRKKNIVPIAAGEHETSHEGFMKLIEGGCVDVVQADVPHHGGLDSVKAIIVACQEHGLEFAFHNWGTELETIADAHVGACFPRETAAWLEYPWYAHRGQPVMYPFPLADEILTEPLAIEGGDLIMSDAPGLGVEINEDVVSKYPYIKGAWSIFEIDSPRQTLHLSGDHALVWDAGKHA
ncbi:MAG: mandelate racemase/muconate lactonizing enzyme family protein [Planctomycetota bacterium]|nr:mandelate racemase/muconate lactonizing enzyme family protein [Planctomycetota bacterium]